MAGRASNRPGPAHMHAGAPPGPHGCEAEGAFLSRQRFFLKGRSVELTISECLLLDYLLSAGRRVVLRPELTRALWGVSSPDTGRAVDAHVYRLRRKLSALPGVDITTIRSRGFRLEIAETSSNNAVSLREMRGT